MEVCIPAVFDLSTAGVQVTGDVTVVKTSFQLDKFRSRDTSTFSKRARFLYSEAH